MALKKSERRNSKINLLIPLKLKNAQLNKLKPKTNQVTNYNSEGWVLMKSVCR